MPRPSIPRDRADHRASPPQRKFAGLPFRAGAAGGIVALICTIVILRSCRHEDRVANLRTAPFEGGILVVGDSLAAGTGALPQESYPALLEAALGCRVVNAGVPGNTTADGLARIDSLLASHPWIVIIELGGNDFLGHADKRKTEENIDEILRRIVAGGSIPVVAGVNLGLFVDEYAEVFERVAKKNNALLIPDLLGGVFGHRELMSDQIHPNAAGYRIVADRITASIRPLVAETGRSCR